MKRGIDQVELVNQLNSLQIQQPKRLALYEQILQDKLTQLTIEPQPGKSKLETIKEESLSIQEEHHKRKKVLPRKRKTEKSNLPDAYTFHQNTQFTFESPFKMYGSTKPMTYKYS